MTEAACAPPSRTRRRACAELGSPFTARLMTLFARAALARTAPSPAGWSPGRATSRPAASPCRCASPARCTALARAGGAGARAALSAPRGRGRRRALARRQPRRLRPQAATIDRWLDSPPQTNEVRRSAVLIAVGHWLARRFGLPIRLSEMGASAGPEPDVGPLRPSRRRPDRSGPDDPVLTLAPDWQGAPPAAAEVRIAERRGVDLAPLSPRDDADRLLAYIWPDQPDRLDLARRALAAADRDRWTRATPRPGSSRA